MEISHGLPSTPLRTRGTLDVIPSPKRASGLPARAGRYGPPIVHYCSDADPEGSLFFQNWVNAGKDPWTKELCLFWKMVLYQ